MKPAVSVGHEALQLPGKVLTPASSTAFKLPVGTASESSFAVPAQAPVQPPVVHNPSPVASAPYYAQAAVPAPAPAVSRTVTAWSGAVVKNAAAAAAATLPAFTPDDFPAALSTKSAPATAPPPPRTLSYASMVGRTPPASQTSRSIASVGSAADMTSEHRRFESPSSTHTIVSTCQLCTLFCHAVVSALVARAVMQLGITTEQVAH